MTGNKITRNLYGLYLWNFGQCPLPKPEILRLSDNTIQDNVRQDIWCIEWNL